MLSRRTFNALLAALTLAPLSALADNYPSKPISLVVPYTAGSSTDVVARIMAEQLRKQLGQPVIVENKPGAGTAIGNAYVANAKPDGYTILYAGSSLTIVSAMTKTSYDPVTDFAAISAVLDLPIFLMARSDLPVKTVPELVAYAKANPGKLNYGSAGPGSITHLQMELAAKSAGIDLLHVPYKGTAAVTTDILGGQLQVAFLGLANVEQHIHSGALRPLAVAMPQRNVRFPDVPTVGETGVLGETAIAWGGLFAPAGTPANVINRLNGELKQALQTPEVRASIQQIGAEPVTSTPEALAARVKSDADKWNPLLATLGLQP